MSIIHLLTRTDTLPRWQEQGEERKIKTVTKATLPYQPFSFDSAMASISIDHDVGTERTISEWIKLYGMTVVKQAYFIDMGEAPFPNNRSCYVLGVSDNGGFSLKFTKSTYVCHVGYVDQIGVGPSHKLALEKASSHSYCTIQ